MFTVRTRCSQTLARGGVLTLAHGDVADPGIRVVATMRGCQPPSP